jgi:hypothetical protein
VKKFAPVAFTLAVLLSAGGVAFASQGSHHHSDGVTVGAEYRFTLKGLTNQLGVATVTVPIPPQNADYILSAYSIANYGAPDFQGITATAKADPVVHFNAGAPEIVFTAVVYVIKTGPET